jgi:hypothetical protein
MSDNAYTREVTITITELVPAREQLPYCAAWLASGAQCSNRARYTQQGRPCCGQHVGRPGLLWVPERWAGAVRS